MISALIDKLLNLKNLQLKKVIYPIMTSSLFLLIVVSTIWEASFISTNINKSFQLSEKEVQSQLITLDLDRFTPIAKRLGIEFNNF